MRILAIAMLLLTGCVSVSAGRPSEKQQYPTWVQELAERRAEALEAEQASGEAGSGSAGEAEGDAEPVAARPLPTVRTSASDARPVARKPRGEMNDREKIQEGVRLLREADAMRQRAAASHDEEEPRLNQRKQALLRQRREFDR